jgi:hypothetical protein
MLVNDRTIRRVPVREIEYFHILFDAHQIIFAEGAPTESFFPGGTALGSLEEETRAEIIELFPELADPAHCGETSRRTLNRAEAEVLVHAAR